jgi:mannonate dehydratase
MWDCWSATHPVHEDIKRGCGRRDEYITNYQQSVRNLASCGIDIVCYNFMPVLDWTRTDLAWELADVGWALRFDHTAFAAFDMFILKRPEAHAEYSVEDVQQAKAYFEQLTAAQTDTLVNTLIAGLPGAEEHYSLDDFRASLRTYSHIDEARLREHLGCFLRAVVPVAEAVGVRMAIHLDDPPRALLGLPRILSTAEDAQWLLDAAPTPATGLTFYTGSYGVREDNDLVAMAKHFAPFIYFTHLRSTRREVDPRSFHDAHHLEGDVDMVGGIAALAAEERRREREGGPRLPLRPDHGHQLLDDQHCKSNSGYSLIGGLKGLAEIRGVELAVLSAVGLMA